MKLRIQGNSVRIRLTQSEVARVGEGKAVEQSTAFASGAVLVSQVRVSSRRERVSAIFAEGRIAIVLPVEQARQWATSDEVGIEAIQNAGDGQALRILVEKDFECLHSAAEGDSDAFPNPRGR